MKEVMKYIGRTTTWIVRPGRSFLKRRWSLLLYVIAFGLVNVALLKKNVFLGLQKDQSNEFFIITNVSNVNLKDLHPDISQDTLTRIGYSIYNSTKILTLRVTVPHGTEDTRQYPPWVIDITNYLWNKTVIPSHKLDEYYKLIRWDTPLGIWPPYDYKPLKDILKPAYEQTKSRYNIDPALQFTIRLNYTTEDNLEVPPIVHFTWFYGNKNQEMKFYTMLCLLGAYKKFKPYKILFWYDIMPSGQWWDYAVKHIPNLLLVYRETPTKIFNQGIEFPEHRSDVTRVEAIVMLGGTYLDLDSVPLSSIDQIRNHSAVQAGTFSYSLANAVIIGAPNNLFHWLFYLNYFKYQPKAWAVNSVLKGMELAKLYPETIYVEYSYIFRPNVPERFYYFTKGWLWNWSQHYTVHLFARYNSENYEYQYIHRRDTVIGEIYRHLLNDDVIPDINKRPSLFEMSWWQQKSCKTFPKGTWDCAAQKTRFSELNQTYHFHPG